MSEEIAKELLVHDQYGRVKGADWFPFTYKRDVLLLGQGGIGSWTGVLLSRLGCNLYLYDMDSYETHNMTGQIVMAEHIGQNKAKAAKDLIKKLSPDASIEAYTEKYNENSVRNDIVICGFDNMLARRHAFENWVKHLETVEDRSKCFFQDGRLLAEQLQIFNIKGDDKESIEAYAKDHLFDDAAVEEAACTFKQTSHAAAMIASHMVGFFTNWVNNEFVGPKVRKVPFKYEYFIPLNMVV